MRWLDERDIGVQVGRAGQVNAQSGKPIRVPIVPAAILFDLWVGDPTHPARRRRRLCRLRGGEHRAARRGQRRRRRRRQRRQALRHRPGDEGRPRQRLGHGQRASPWAPSSPSTRSATSSIRPPAPSSPARAPPTAARCSARCARCCRATCRAPLQIGSATTLAIVATDAILTKAEANKVAQMAQDGLARSINPVHTDDRWRRGVRAGHRQRPGRGANVTLLGALAAEVLADAVLRGVLAARGIGGAGLPDLPAAADL